MEGDMEGEWKVIWMGSGRWCGGGVEGGVEGEWKVVRRGSRR